VRVAVFERGNMFPFLELRACDNQFSFGVSGRFSFSFSQNSGIDAGRIIGGSYCSVPVIAR
jgi:hypothetical protein